MPIFVKTTGKTITRVGSSSLATWVGASNELVGDGFFFFFYKFSYFKIVMILLMLNVNADECVLISDMVLPPRMSCQFVKVWL